MDDTSPQNEWVIDAGEEQNDVRVSIQEDDLNTAKIGNIDDFEDLSFVVHFALEDEAYVEKAELQIIS